MTELCGSLRAACERERRNSKTPRPDRNSKKIPEIANRWLGGKKALIDPQSPSPEPKTPKPKTSVWMKIAGPHLAGSSAQSLRSGRQVETFRLGSEGAGVQDFKPGPVEVIGFGDIQR